MARVPALLQCFIDNDIISHHFSAIYAIKWQLLENEYIIYTARGVVNVCLCLCLWELYTVHLCDSGSSSLASITVSK